MSSARFTRRCFLAGAALGTAVKAGDPQPIGELVGGMAELVKLQRLPRVASNVAPSEFPQTDDVWQADFFHSPTFISHDDVGVECVMADELPELHDFCRMLASDEISGLSVIYDEVAVMAPADLYLVERNGWPVRTPEAYPVALRFEPGRQPQPPSGQDLEYIDSCLQIIPDFVRRGVDPKTYEVETNGKRVKLRLSWTASTTP